MSKFIVCHYNPHKMTEHKNNHVTLNFTMITSQFVWPFLPVVDLFFEVARTFQSYKASLMLAYSDVCMGCLASVYSACWGYRDRINSLW